MSDLIVFRKPELDFLHIDCECSDSNHSIRFNKGFDEDDPGSVELSFQLYQYFTLWDRIKSAVKYIFTGIGSAGWDSVLISSSESRRIVKYLSEHLNKDK